MKKHKNINGFHFRNDVIFVAVLLLVSAIGFIYLFVLRSEGNTVKVTVDGNLYGTYPLSRNVTEEIVTGNNGENLNRFVINGGKVYMQEASCPDGICVSHRAVFRDGESIVCLPNRVIITVIAEDDTDTPDIVA